jgi:pimeloyl-ACP methyl ester carboxylesterase
MSARLNYKISGKGLPFVFQHGLTANLEQAQGLLSPIQGVKLISIDCPGHGASPLPADTKPSFDYYVDLLIDWMDEWKVEKAVWGGISMGSGIALNAGIRYPERVSGMVLIRPAWLDRGNPKSLQILQVAAEAIVAKGKRYFIERSDFQEINKILPQAAASILGVFEPQQRPELSRVIECMVKDAPFDHLRSLENIKSPGLIIGSDDDPLHPYFMAEKIHQHLPGSQLVKVISRYIDDTQHRLEVKNLVSNFIKNK